MTWLPRATRATRATRALAVAAFAGGALVGLAGTALATPDDPVSGDDRATVHPGNVVGKDCDTLFPGSTEVAPGDLEFTIDETNTYIDITGIADGVEVVGVIVKGGPAYNQYEALGDLPWLELHSPLVPSGKPAEISHWFACGVEATPTTSPTTDTPTSTEEPVTSVPATTTSDQPVAPAASEDEDELAATGADTGWLVALGAALLLGGGALLFLVRMRGARR